MDEICFALAERFSAAGKNAYAVYYEDELTECFTCEDDRTRENLEAALKELMAGGYIDVKYARGSAYCISLLKEYEKPEPAPQPAAAEPARKKKKIKLQPFILPFLSSFAGGALGSFIAGIIAALAV